MTPSTSPQFRRGGHRVASTDHPSGGKVCFLSKTQEGGDGKSLQGDRIFPFTGCHLAPGSGSTRAEDLSEAPLQGDMRR
jgi:hypothetical protein